MAEPEPETLCKCGKTAHEVSLAHFMSCGEDEAAKAWAEDFQQRVADRLERDLFGVRCKCGHLEAAHSAGECWTEPDNTDHPDPACPCSWYEPVGGAVAEPLCRCGHPASAHDAGECWTHPDNDDHPTPACPCNWYEETS